MKKTIPSTIFLLLVLLVTGCTPASTPGSAVPPEPMTSNEPLTIGEAEELAGFNVKEPGYLPKGVTFDSVSYQTQPSPTVILSFNLTHETYGEMGKFFQIMQQMQAEAPADAVSCGDTADGCEVLQIQDIPIVYRLNPAGPEGLDWHQDGFTFRLLRTAGEPNKVYKDELIKIVESMQ